MALVHREQHEDNDAYDRWEQINSGEWVAEHKDERQSTVYKHVPTSRLFQVDSSRRGSYWTDYEYEEPEVFEVRAVEVTVTQYEAI